MRNNGSKLLEVSELSVVSKCWFPISLLLDNTRTNTMKDFDLKEVELLATYKQEEMELKHREVWRGPKEGEGRETARLTLYELHCSLII